MEDISGKKWEVGEREANKRDPLCTHEPWPLLWSHSEKTQDFIVVTRAVLQGTENQEFLSVCWCEAVLHMFLKRSHGKINNIPIHIRICLHVLLENPCQVTVIGK